MSANENAPLNSSHLSITSWPNSTKPEKLFTKKAQDKLSEEVYLSSKIKLVKK